MKATSARGQATRANLIAAAIDCFREHGVQGASMDVIAATAGVTKPTAYAHFGSKEQLFKDVVEVLKAEPRQRVLPDYEPGKDVIEQLTAMFSAFLEKQLQHETVKLFRAIIVEMSRQNIELPPDPDNFPDSPLELWLKASNADGATQIEDPFIAAINIWSIVKGRFLWPVLIGFRQLSPEDRYEELAKALEEAITPLLVRT